jgi:hypothetical protein
MYMYMYIHVGDQLNMTVYMYILTYQVHLLYHKQ